MRLRMWQALDACFHVLHDHHWLPRRAVDWACDKYDRVLGVNDG